MKRMSILLVSLSCLGLFFACFNPVGDTSPLPTSNPSPSTPSITTPIVPTGVAVTAADAQVGITWTAVVGATGYNVYRSTASGSQGAKLNATTITIPSYTDATVTNGIVYYYQVTAVNAGGESAGSIQQSARPQVPAAGAPTGFSATGGNAQVAMTWTAVSGATGYNVYRSTSSGTQGAKLNATAITIPSYTDTTVTNGTAYYYQVTAVNAGGESAGSIQQSATPQVPAAGAPTGFSATGGNAQVVMTWTAVSGATGYNVYRSTSSGTQGAKLNATAITITSYADATVTNGTAYYYQVTAVNAGGESAGSTQQSATPQVPAPSTPTGFSATGGNAQVAMTWTAVSGASAYNVYRSTTSGAQGSKINATAITTPSYTDTTVSNGTVYYYRVTAVNAGGESAGSAAQSATPQVPVPSIPTGVTVTAGNSQVSLAWATVLGASGYNVYRSTTEGTRGSKIASPSSASYSDTAVTNGTIYYYQVTATNAGGESGASSQVSASPQVPAPGTPSGLSACARNAQVSLNWVTVSGATGYNVYRSTAAGTQGSLLASPTSRSYSDETVTNGITYYYQVSATNAGGESAVSSQVICYTYGSTGPGGGLVFYDYGSSQSWGRYLEAAPIDQGTSPTWSYLNNNITTGATADTYGSGKANTSAIISAQGAGNYAASLCANYLGGGKSDWYLPGKYELYMMYYNLKAQGFGNFSAGNYWSSTESSFNDAWRQNFGSASQILAPKNYSGEVRAIRAF